MPTQTGFEAVPYPGTPATADGTAAVVWVETHVSQGACAYPITPSTGMGNGYQLAVANGQRNLWGETLFFFEPESEHSSASVCEGFALAGGRVANFTSGQGLVLMKEVLYVIAGKRLPAVFHVGARALTSQALNIHAGHDDVMAVADTGWGMLFARNAQEAQDLALVARRAAEASRTPFLNVQDGFLTTHTLESLRLAEPELMAAFVGAPGDKLVPLFDPQRPLMTGTVQNQDAYMKGRIAQRYFYDQVPGHLQSAFAEFHRLTGRRYDFVHPYRLEDAEYALVGLGSVMDTAMAAVDWMREGFGWKAGALAVTAYRPFPGRQIAAALKRCRAIAVLERTDNPLAQDNPLTAEVKAAMASAAAGAAGYPALERMPAVYSGVYGLGSRDTRVGDLVAAVANMREQGKRFFSLGINHPTALPRRHDPDVRAPGSFSMRGHSVGGYGSVTTNKIIASLVGDIFGLSVQAYSRYGSDKKGLPTTYYLTVSEAPIREHAELKHVEFVAVNDVNALRLGETLEGLKEGGALFIHSPWEDDRGVWEHIPPGAREEILNRGLRVFYLDTLKIARASASTPDLALRFQGVVLLGVFLRVAPFVRERGYTEARLFEGVEQALQKYFGRRGEKVVRDNLAAARRGYSELKELDLGAVAQARRACVPVQIG